MPEDFKLRLKLRAEGLNKFAMDMEKKLRPVFEKLSKYISPEIGKKLEAGFRIGAGLPLGKEFEGALRKGGIVMGIGRMIGLITKVSAIVTIISEGVNRVGNFFKGFSFILEQVWNLFTKSVTLIFKPIGDFVGLLLRPFILMFLKYVALPFYRSVYPTLMKLGNDFNEFMKQLPDWLKPALGGAFGGAMVGFMMGGPIGALIGGGLGALLTWLATVDWGKVWESLSGFVSFVVTGISNSVKTALSVLAGLGKWLWDTIVGAISGGIGAISEFGSWLWNIITLEVSEKIQMLADFGKWLWDNIVKLINFAGAVWDGLRNFGTWLFDSIKQMILSGLGVLADLGKKIMDWVWGQITGAGKAVARFLGFGGGKAERERQFGGYIPTTGLYYMHAGEYVIPASKSTSKVVNLNMNFDINANVRSEADIDEIVDRIKRELAFEVTRWDRW